jgi:hypothetical protein
LFRSLKLKEWNKQYAPQADHVDPIGSAPKDWNGWDVYFKRMFEGKLKPICRDCHHEKTQAERKARKGNK